MNVRPIPFNPAMVRALLAGRKTQTRRVLTKLTGFGKITEFGPSDTPAFDWHFRDREMLWHDLQDADLRKALPYSVGDLLYVREEHWAVSIGKVIKRLVTIAFKADGATIDDAWPDRCVFPTVGVRRAPMHLPREFSRLTLRVTEVRVQRVQAINDADALEEGVDRTNASIRGYATKRFGWLWDSINAQRGFGWEANPWVVAVSFEVIRENVDTVLAREATDG